MIVRRLFTAVMLLAWGVTAFAQEGELEWSDITALNYVATGGKDPSHCLRQFLLFDEASAESHPDIIARYRTFSGN